MDYYNLSIRTDKYAAGLAAMDCPKGFPSQQGLHLFPICYTIDPAKADSYFHKGELPTMIIKFIRLR
ncbi:hypothetical protein [Paenibacillus nasutitermitis]|uniref:Uncharacterized protein n=1 Tax=Paenibacillus nasutitermitis TaxID=1652958 RepID=A0A916Z674_9BACL|nr:hypothetical protein [Paenibacillus nasutitermitis]GGD78339.1 hypothetical protein GCM10010911_40470 [Paenibacillus nasutitermitis]